MRGLLLVLLLLAGGWWGALQRVHDANQALRLGAGAYARRDYAAAAAAYARARALGAHDESVLLNLGHAYARLGRTTEARQAYGGLLQSASLEVRSVARQQLAVLAATEGNYPQATTLLRQALLDNPRNTAARYNYELLRLYHGRRNDPQLPPPPPPPAERQPQPGGSDQQSGETQPGQAPPQPAPASGNQGTGQGSKAGNLGGNTNRETAQGNSPGNTRGLDTSAEGTDAGNRNGAASGEAANPNDNRVITRQRLAPLNLNEAQARQLLDALQAAEQQYLQQIPHKGTQRPDPRKPAW
ncbi:tetratricopeptide repeat protein [Hymenobacter latericus]|uniref:tetratricopeptide repeat protein n=1 Tax=Hymenobacter sp. YIM 151858-1 TaxID=2987688 RepID=UPI002226C31E|nr:hypothetical protein [Hymenobacter sp. YIM 151858-1]UYZ60550.1 hypothetical protein OIS50_07065 [Hymenobacter sp. YIM 151858-1]